MIRPLLAAAAVFALLAAACASEGGDDPLESGASSPTAPSGTACAPARTRATGDSGETMTSGGADREYLLHVPTDYDGAIAAPVLLALHGAASTGEALRNMSGLDVAADARGMIVAYPESATVGNAAGWNADNFADGPDDSLFLSELLDALGATLCIDATRVYVTGLSHGGAMALRFACDAPKRIAAVAPVAAPYVACQAAVPMVAFHGSQDPLVPYEGGTSPLTGQPSPPVHRAASDWARSLGCDGLATISRPAADVELATYGNCTGGGAEVLLYNAIDGGHTWPGATVDVPEEIAGKTTRSISATDLMLDFFDAADR